VNIQFLDLCTFLKIELTCLANKVNESRMEDHPFRDDTREKVGVIVYDKKGYVLMVQGVSGKLSLPKGGRLRGETELEGALREAYEETGIDLERFEYTEKIKLVWGTYFIYRIPYLGVSMQLRAEPKEILKIIWRKPTSIWLQTEAKLNCDLGCFIKRVTCEKQ
jgi:8-oxo-dGTP pyrophosphatase MutT (NUDIX family)